MGWRHDLTPFSRWADAVPFNDLGEVWASWRWRILALGLAACADRDPPAPANVQVQQPVTPDYKIGPLDTIQIFVWQSPEFSVTVPVRPDGRISTPLIEDLEATGTDADPACPRYRGEAEGLCPGPAGDGDRQRLRRSLRPAGPRRRRGASAARHPVPRQHDHAGRHDRGRRPDRVRVGQQGGAGPWRHRHRQSDAPSTSASTICCATATSGPTSRCCRATSSSFLRAGSKAVRHPMPQPGRTA